MEEGLEDKRDRVLRALGDRRWDFRTIPGLAKETEMSEDEITEILASLDDQVRQSDVPDRQGRRLFTLKSRPPTGLERLAKLRNFLAKSSA